MRVFVRGRAINGRQPAGQPDTGSRSTRSGAASVRLGRVSQRGHGPIGWRTAVSVAAAALLATGLTAAAPVGSASAAEGGSPMLGAAKARPLILAHRGASGYRPEHTLAAYELAASFGVDYLEPDLVSTKDGQLVDRHEPEISGTTDVAARPEFAKRKTTKKLDGVATTGWFTEDFTLAELRTLRAKERIPDIRQHNTIYNGRYQVPTFREVLELRQKLSAKYHRQIGVIPEIKHSTYFKQRKLPLEDRVLAELRRFGLDRPGAPVIIQSFEVANLKYLHGKTKLPLVQLTSASGQPYDFTVAGDKRTYADLVSAKGLKEVAKYAQILGPDKNQIIPRDAAGKLTKPTTLVADAHRAKMRVTPYTFRNENTFLPAEYRVGTNPADYGNAFAEYKIFFATGIDGLFSDNADTAIAARDAYLGTKN